jgi:predicted O-linked N-acetylglucosamine transferase (SPINDLY family)
MEPDLAAQVQSALAHQRAGRLGEAEIGYRRVLDATPDHVDALQLLGLVRSELGAQQEAIDLIERAIGLEPAAAQLHFNLAHVLERCGRAGDAIECYRTVLRLQPESPARFAMGEALLAAGRFREAVECYQAVAGPLRDSCEAHYGLGIAQLNAGAPDLALAPLQSAVRLAPGEAGAHTALGACLMRLERTAEAIDCFERAATLAPDLAEVHCNLGSALVTIGDFDRALPSLDAAIERNPCLPQAVYNRGLAFQRLGRAEDALADFDEAIRLDGGFAAAHSSRALALWNAGRRAEAYAACREALRLDAELSPAHVLLGNLLKDDGEASEALSCYRRALELDPAAVEPRFNLIFVSHYLEGCSPEQIFGEIGKWGARFALAKNTSDQDAFPNSRQPERRLRVGYLSGNLRTHPGGIFLGAVLGAHDRKMFHVTCYVNSPIEDEHSERIKSTIDTWHNVFAWSDRELAEQIRSDGIDILVEMNRFTGGGRLAALAERLAPIQVSWMGGPITSTGLPTIDYVLSDAVHTPPEYDRYFSEEIVRLRNAYAVYQAPPYAPPVGELPAARNGYVTFGCFNNLAKLQPGVLGAWAMILKQVPGSRMLLQSKQFGDLEPRRRIESAFAALGIDLASIDLRPGLSHAQILALYNEVDIALDPFPYSGGVTTCEALWMGVPVICAEGSVIPVRHSVSHLRNAGLKDWIAISRDAYIDIAVELASSTRRLATTRKRLRRKVEASKLCDRVSFARELEAAYRKMWRSRSKLAAGKKKHQSAGN